MFDQQRSRGRVFGRTKCTIKISAAGFLVHSTNLLRSRSKPLSKTQLITKLADETELPKKKIDEVLSCLLATAYREAKKEHGFTLPGLGKLVVTKRSARMGRNPQTGEPIKIPAKKALKFRIAKAAKDAVLGVKK